VGSECHVESEALCEGFCDVVCEVWFIVLAAFDEIDECVDEVIGGLVDRWRAGVGHRLALPPPMKTNDRRVNAVGLVSVGASGGQDNSFTSGVISSGRPVNERMCWSRLMAVG